MGYFLVVDTAVCEKGYLSSTQTMYTPSLLTMVDLTVEISNVIANEAIQCQEKETDVSAQCSQDGADVDALDSTEANSYELCCLCSVLPEHAATHIYTCEMHPCVCGDDVEFDEEEVKVLARLDKAYGDDYYTDEEPEEEEKAVKYLPEILAKIEELETRERRNMSVRQLFGAPNDVDSFELMPGLRVNFSPIKPQMAKSKKKYKAELSEGDEFDLFGEFTMEDEQAPPSEASPSPT
jgi:hypothetical protein